MRRSGAHADAAGCTTTAVADTAYFFAAALAAKRPTVAFAAIPRVAADPSPPSTESWAAGCLATRVRGASMCVGQCLSDEVGGALHGFAAARSGPVQQKNNILIFKKSIFNRLICRLIDLGYE